MSVFGSSAGRVLWVVVAAGAVAASDVSAQTRWVVAAEGNEARYLVREQLAGFEFPNDAVGRTPSVSGGIVVGEDGAVVHEGSRFEIDLATLQSDEARRDNYLRRNTLETETHPSAVFVPTEILGLSVPLQASGETTFEVVGQLTLKEVTRQITWAVTARVENGTIAGTATTQFTFEELGLTKPSLARLLSVADEIRLEYDFRLERER